MSCSRREVFIRGTGALAGFVAGGGLPKMSIAKEAGSPDRTLQNLQNTRGRSILIKDAIVFSMDKKVGNFERADILIQDKRIASLGVNLAAPQSAIHVDASGMIAMPGFVDTHHHQHQSLLRGVIADGVSARVEPQPKVTYPGLVLQTLTPAYLPEDVYVAERLASANQVNAGVTTVVDISQIHLSEAHTDACIAGLKASGRRAVLAYGPSIYAAADSYGEGIRRLRKQYFSTADQLLTLAGAGRAEESVWKITRSVGASIVNHMIGTTTGDLAALYKAGVMGPDNEYIHCTQLTEENWKAIAETGGKISIAPAAEMKGHQYPQFKQALAHGIQPSLSIDVESGMTADMFTTMRAAFMAQRADVDDKPARRLLTCAEVIEMGTISGARAAQLDSKIGSLSPGKEADLILLSTDRINAFPLNNVPATVVTLMETSNVEHVFVAGKVMKWNGELVGIDIKRLRQDATKARDGIFARAKVSRNLFDSCCFD